MNKKYFLLSLLFFAGLSLHGFVDHYEHSDNQHVSECQACEENVDIKIASTKSKNIFIQTSPKTNLNSRFVNHKNKSNLSRAPPLN
jgi:hypothetical protein